MMDRRLQVFHAVVKQKSFTKAAESLFMTQPAVTFQIRALEEHFNTRVLDRGRGQVALTPAGAVLLEYAERILGQYAELDVRMSELTGGIGGSLMIGASMNIAEFVLPRIIGEFSNRYPEVQSRLAVANSETIESQVAEHALDIGLIDSPSHLPSLQVEECCEDEMTVIVSPRHALAQETSVTPKQLTAHPIVSREQGAGSRETTELYLRKAGINVESLKIAIEVGSLETVKGVVETGLGYAIVSRLAIEKELKLGRLVALPLNPRLKRSLCLVYPKERFRSRLVNTFVDFTKEKLRAALK